MQFFAQVESFLQFASASMRSCNWKWIGCVR